MRILYMPIFEGGSVHDTQFAQKRGLYTALARAGHSVVEVDYLDYITNWSFPLYGLIAELIDGFEFDLVFTQFHGANILTVDEIRDLRRARTAMRWVNWSGDSWAHSLTAQPILDMAREFDLQLVAAPDALPTYEASGINAAYWNIAYEPPVVPLPEMPSYDVVFLANVINDKRRALMEMLRGLEGVSVGIYGDWEHADGRNVYDFAAGEALYKNAKIAIADNTYDDQTNYVSNRPMQAMGAGCLVLHQHVPKMEALTGWKDRTHYVGWSDLDELKQAIPFWLGQLREPKCREIVAKARRQVLSYHSWEYRVEVLFKELLPTVRERVT